MIQIITQIKQEDISHVEMIKSRVKNRMQLIIILVFILYKRVYMIMILIHTHIKHKSDNSVSSIQ